MKKSRIVNPSEIGQNVYSDKAASQRNSDVGLCLAPLGQVSATKRIASDERKAFAAVVFYNNTAAPIYVAFGDKDLVAPTTAANGFPILAGEKAVLNSGSSTHVAASAPIFAYLHIEE
jgi:hypothetical protein